MANRMQALYQGAFANIDFPDYEFREYPKQIELADGRLVVAKNQKEELDLRADAALKPPHPAELQAEALSEQNNELALAVSEKDRLIAELEAKLAALDKPVAQA